MAIISRPSIPEVVFERVKTDLTEFGFNFFQDGVSLDVSARTYKVRLRVSGILALDKAAATNSAGRVTFTLSDSDKTALVSPEYQFFLVEILAGGGEKTLLAGTLRWSVPAGKTTGLVAAPDVSVNYIAATQELMVALGVVDFGSLSSGASAAEAQASAQAAQDALVEVAEIQLDVAAKSTSVDNKATSVLAAAAAVATDRQVVTELVNNAALAENPLGEYDAATNTPARSATPPAAPTVPVKSYHEITVAGPAQFAGSNFAVGQTLAVGGRLIKKSETQWFYAPPTDLAITKSLQLEKDLIIADLMTENVSANSLNGGVATSSPPVITVPVGQTGYQSSLTKTIQIANHAKFAPGTVIRFYFLYTASDISIRNTKILTQLNVNRGAGTISNQSGTKTEVVENGIVKVYYDYTVQATDVWLQPFMQVAGSGISNDSGADWVFTLKSVYTEIRNPAPEVSKITKQFEDVGVRIASAETNIASNSAAIQQKAVNLSVVPTSYNGQALNGATGGNTKRVTIPTGQTGNQSYVRALIPIEEFPNWNEMMGQLVDFKFKVLTSPDFYPAKGLTLTLTVFRSGADITGTISNVSITKLSSTVLQVSFRYQPNQSDTILKPWIQTPNSGAAVAADSFFEMQEITYSHALPLGFSTENNYPAAKEKAWNVGKIRSLEGRATTLEGQMTTANAGITARTLNNSVVPSSYNGQAVAGATGGNTKRVSIPAGQTGNGSYVRALIPIAEIPNWSDLVGVPVTFTYRVLISTDFYPDKSLSSTLTVFRSGADVAGSISGNTITKISANVLQVKFTYTPNVNDSILKPYIQTSGAGAAVAADSFFEMQEISYSHAVPVGYPSESTYAQSKEKAWLMARIQSLTDRLTAAEGSLTAPVVRVVKTVKPDGTGDYLSPKLANDAITDSSATKQYEIVIYPGVYTEVEWKCKPYTHWRGIDPKTCWLKGDLPDSSDNSHQTTSTVWLVQTASLLNLKITARNMRYAVHSENSGGNPDHVHNVYNCDIEHFGNQGLIDWRTANPGAGLNVGDVWASARPWGYGSASGLIENYENTRFAADNREGYYVHSNQNFSKPTINTLRNCRIVRGNFGQVVVVESLGSGQPDIVDMRGCSVTPGYIRHTDSPWITQLAANQYANHANFSIYASGCSPMGYRDATRGKALRIKSNSAATGSKVRVSGDAAPLIFGTAFEMDGCAGLPGYVFGYWDISGILVGISSDVAVNNTLGKRLGDCSAVSKTLTVNIDGGISNNVVFNANYTGSTNASIIAFINSVLGSAAVADEYNPALNEYYPEFEDRIITVKNTGTVGIPRFNAVGFNTDRGNIRLITTADPASKFIGIALENIAIGKAGRVLISGILEKNVQIPGVSGVVSMDTDISLSSTVNGQFELSSAKVVMKGIATDWAQFKATI